MARFEHISNVPLTHRDAVKRAAIDSGKNVIWNEQPSTDGMSVKDAQEAPARYGSIWSSEDDLGEFWDRYIELTEKA